MMKLVAEADIRLAHPEAIIAPVCEHLVGHGGRVARDGDAWVLTFPGSVARLRATPGRLTASAAADDGERLYLLKMGIAHHVLELAKDPAIEIAWSGDGADVATPPNFRVLTVVHAVDVTPHMRRVRLTGPDIDRFLTDAGMHVKLLLPRDRAAPPAWPAVGRDGRIVWPEGEDAPAPRTYTIRRFDRVARTIDVDFVVHEDPGPGAAWAGRAAPGDLVGMMGPGGGGLPSADWLLLAGDETALPAIARILESLPPAARGVVLVEVADAAEEQRLRRPEGMELRWLHRGDGRPSLAEAVRSVALPEDGSSVFVWAAAEIGQFRAIRSYLRKERDLPKDQHYVAAYWRKGGRDAGRDDD